MSLLIEIKGITKLSELEIDADKDWQVKGIINLKQLAALMSRGDIVVRGDDILVRLAAGPDGYVLTSAGPGKIPSWQPAGGALKYYFPVYVSSTHGEVKVLVNREVLKTIAPGTDKKYACDDRPTDYIKLLSPAVSLSKAMAKPAVDKSYNKNAPIGRDISILIDGAVSETSGGSQTDETAAARDPTLNDMNLCPMTPAVDDKYYFGFDKTFRRIWLNVSTAGVGNWTNIYEYWNGSTWVQVSDEGDQTSSFTASGIKRINWTMPGDWARTTILGMNLYWVRARTTSYVAQTQKPKGGQAWCCLVT